MKPITRKDRGAAVEDVQQRLRSLGYDLGPAGIDGRYSDATADAVRAFRADEGLPDGEVVDSQTWSALVDATFRLGDRTLFLKLPYFHGRDVREMQTALNVLGFGSVPVDGIFGAHTESALREFQRNVGIAPDGIAGSWTFDAITRLHQVWQGRDATPHSGTRAGFARAAEVLEQFDVCFWGSDATTRDISNRIANLALATTDSSRVSSADTRMTMPDAQAILVEIAFEGDLADHVEGTPIVAYVDDEPTFAARIKTAIRAARTSPRRICISLPAAGEEGLTVRMRQHYTVSMLDALCTALA